LRGHAHGNTVFGGAFFGADLFVCQFSDHFIGFLLRKPAMQLHAFATTGDTQHEHQEYALDRARCHKVT